MPGMRMSSSTTSGTVSVTTRTPAAPSAASPTTSMSGSAASTMRRPVRTIAWSSTRTTRMLMRPPPRVAAGTGKEARTRYPPPRTGPTSSRPPATATRSRMCS
jgi:hypothetical protein